MAHAGIGVKQADGDADTLMVTTAMAVAEASNQAVMVVGTYNLKLYVVSISRSDQ